MLKITNTLGKQKQEFKPIQDNLVTFYQCGPTVYSRQHVGNLSSAVRGDTIRRALEYLGYKVKYVRNITDVGHLVSDDDEGEDKMAKGAAKEKTTPEQIAKKYTELYHKDINALNVKEPEVETIATEYIKPMANLVQDLIDRGYAYSTELAVYFDVDKLDNYTKLSGQKLEKNIQGAGHGEVADPGKKNPYDFAVWFFKCGSHSKALQTWEHKFSGIEQKELQGFPGWHIECSAMARETLGKTIDIHMGGIEHIPVHHTNEIAQSESANDAPFANYWLHHELLLIDGGKMSKSLGNVYSLDDLEEKGFEPLVYRYFLLQAHYRSKQNFTWEAMEASKTAYQKLISSLARLDSTQEGEVDLEYKKQFNLALEDDFNIPKALSIVWEILKSDINDSIKLSTIYDFDKVLGLSLKEKVKEEVDKTQEEYPEEVKKLIKQRQEAREKKDWAAADAIRDRLKEEFGVNVMDK